MTSNVCRILIIDADVENRADLRKMILEGSDRQYEFEEADLGANALKQLRASTAKPFDCILYCIIRRFGSAMQRSTHLTSELPSHCRSP